MADAERLTADPARLTPPLRVSVVVPYGLVGGAERWLLRLLEATDRLRVDAVLLGDGPLRDALATQGIPTSVLPVGRSGLAIAGGAIRLARILRRRRPDAVLANGVKAAAAAVPAGKLTGVPVVWAKHDYSFDRRLSGPLGRAAARVVAATEAVGTATGRDDVVVVPPPAPDEPPVPRDRARRFWADRGLRLDGTPTAVMATRLTPYKGVDDAIAAIARPDGSGWRLVVLGIEDPTAPGERDRLRALADSFGVGDRVDLLDPVPEVDRWLSAFDAMAVLTKDDEHGFRREAAGTAALEAMFAGVPVITVSGSDVAARLQDAAGIVVPPADPGAVAEALAALSSADARERMGRAGRDLMADHPDARDCADLLVSVLAEAAVRPGAGLRTGPPVSVVTTVLNEGPATDELLRGLRPQLGASDEMLVVDGGSTDDTVPRARDWERRDPRIRVVEEPGAGISRGRNLGVEAAANPVVAFTDAGCEPQQGWLDALRAPFAGSRPPDLVTGLYRVTSDTIFGTASAVADYPDPAEARHPGPLVRAYGRLLGRVFDATMPTGRSMACTRGAWERVGGFREDLATAEDVSFGRALHRAGARCVLQADAVVAWTQRPSLGATLRMYARYGAGDARSGDVRLHARNAARAFAYGTAPLVATAGGRWGRVAVILGAACYLSLPVVRALRRPRGAAVASMVPAALAVKDLAKVGGWLGGLAGRRT